MVPYAAGVGALKCFAQMAGQLVPKEVKIHPSICAAPLSATQYVAVEVARRIKIVDVKGEVKKALHGRFAKEEMVKHQGRVVPCAVLLAVVRTCSLR